MDLNIKNLSVTIEEKKIIENLNIDIEAKNLVGIIGPNGSGKSTLLKTIYRVLKYNEGSIYINGKDIKVMSLRETAKEMAVVAQHNEQEFDFNVYDMVLIGRSPHKKFLERDSRDDYEIVDEALEKVDMLAYKERKYNSLSGGEKQRIILARALAQQTNCLILDEPTNHLDIKYQFQFMNIAKNLDITVIAAIHDLNIASLYCDEIYALKDGKIVKSGSPTDIFTEKLIYDLYEVESRIIKEDGKINILYKPY